MNHYAIEGVAKPVVVIKDNKIVAKGVSVLKRGDDWVSIKLSQEDVEKYLFMIPSSIKEIMDSVGHIHVSPLTGIFLQTSFILDDDLCEEVEKIFENSYTVDHFNLRYGMVPKNFENAEDYRAAIINSD
jgi:hypothetical protein